MSIQDKIITLEEILNKEILPRAVEDRKRLGLSVPDILYVYAAVTPESMYAALDEEQRNTIVVDISPITAARTRNTHLYDHGMQPYQRLLEWAKIIDSIADREESKQIFLEIIYNPRCIKNLHEKFKVDQETFWKLTKGWKKEGPTIAKLVDSSLIELINNPTIYTSIIAHEMEHFAYYMEVPAYREWYRTQHNNITFSFKDNIREQIEKAQENATKSIDYMIHHGPKSEARASLIEWMTKYNFSRKREELILSRVQDYIASNAITKIRKRIIPHLFIQEMAGVPKNIAIPAANYLATLRLVLDSLDFSIGLYNENHSINSITSKVAQRLLHYQKEYIQNGTQEAERYCKQLEPSLSKSNPSLNKKM